MLINQSSSVYAAMKGKKMTKIKAFANYNVLTHEKQAIFTVSQKHPYATFSEMIEIILPTEYQVFKNEYEEILITIPEGETYIADEIISSWKNKPVLRWYNKENNRIDLEFKIL